jgi:hypothetical protein
LLEAMRRLLLLGGLMAAAYAFFMPAQALLRVKVADFEKDLRSRGENMAGAVRTISRESGAEIDPAVNPYPHKTLVEFVGEQIEGRHIEVGGPAWEKLYREASDTLTGLSNPLGDRLDDGSGYYHLYFHPDEQPLAEVSERMNAERPFWYVSLCPPDQLAQKGAKCLEVTRQGPRDSAHGAPASLAYPLRRHVAWLLAAALIGYLVLPRPRRGQNELFYLPARSCVVPDFLAAFLATAFFIVPLLVIPSNASDQTVGLLDFQDGWGYLTIIMWAFVAMGLSIAGISLLYAVSSLWLLPEGLRRRTFWSDRMIRYVDISAVEPAVREFSRWLRMLMYVVALGNWRMWGPLLIFGRSRTQGVRLRLSHGRKVDIWTDSLVGGERLLDALRERGLALPPEMAGLVLDEEGSPRVKYAPGRAGLVVGTFLVMLLAGGALAAQYWPRATPAVVKREHFTTEQLQQRIRLTEQMAGVQQQMTAALAKAKAAADAKDQAGYKAAMDTQAALLKEYQRLDKEHDAIAPTLAP